MPKRVSFIVFLGLVSIIVFATGISAGAAPRDDVETKETEVSSARDRLVEIQAEAGASYEAYNNALAQLNRVDKEMDAASEDLGAAEDRLAEAQASLESRASQVYKSGNVAFLDVLVGVDNFSEFASRLDIWMRLLGLERAEVEAVLSAKKELEAEQDRLEDQRSRRESAVEDAAAQKEQAASAEAEAEAYLNSLNSELQAAIEAEQARLAAEARAAATAPLAEIQTVQTAQVNSSAAEQRAADLAAEREAAEAAAVEAERQAELAERAGAAERRAEAEAARQAAEQAAIEEAAAQLEAQQVAAEQQAAEQQAAEQQAAEQQAAEQQPVAQPAANSGGEPAPSSGGSASGSAVVAEAETWLGTPYVWGGTSRSGVDCSGLTMMVYAEFGVSLPRTTGEQFGVGTPVSSPAPGDLVFFGSGGNITSVGIVTGPDTAIKATVPGDVVRYVSISEVGAYTGGVAGYRRVL